MAFKLPGKKSKRKAAPDDDHEATVMLPQTLLATTPPPAPSFSVPVRPFIRPLPLIGKLPTARQYTILGTTLLVLALAGIFTVIRDSGQSANGAVYLATSANMRMLTQRIAKAAQGVLVGNSGMFRELQGSHDQFVAGLGLLMQGGEASGLSVPASSDAVQPVLDQLSQDWQRTARNINILFVQQKNLATIATASASLDKAGPMLRGLMDEVQAMRVKARPSPAEMNAAAQTVQLATRMNEFMDRAELATEGAAVPPDLAETLEKEGAVLREQISGMEKAAPEGPLQVKLAELDGAFAAVHGVAMQAANAAVGLSNARLATRQIVDDSETLFTGTQKVVQAYETELTRRRGNFVALGAFVSLAAIVIWLMVRVYVTEERRRTDAADEQRAAIEHQNNVNQNAILKLMNEMDPFSRGDLRGRATVGEDITGAIADAVNRTVEELSKLVASIDQAATQLGSATQSAQGTSEQLLAAADHQSREITGASARVLNMAQAMSTISGSAMQSAEVARQSLAASGKGRQAVQNAITGMDEIRGQIQETSKRIKRLGESSQEIGEIVELISGITEETNVLALNAAIQAAGAGEAGRGFSMVAEEVQRLAERSAAATRSIAAIVKTIQADTQETVSAMEKSTQGVVEGARLSDAAGRALAEIGAVSQQLAALVAGITAITEEQSRSVDAVAGNMQDILNITEQGRAGTQRTVQSIDQLSQLAQSLKGSVANFKI